VNTQVAIQMAQEKGLDLVEVSPNAKPPVCKIIDYGKFKYEKKKRDQAAKKKQVIIEVKELQFRPKTDVHDFEFKTRHAIRFLEDGDKVKASVLFRGREITRKEMGHDLMQRLIEALKDHAEVEAPPVLEGRKLSVIFAPVKKKAAPKKESSAKKAPKAPKMESTDPASPA